MDWTTEDEKNFIFHIGEFRLKPGEILMERKEELLRNYKASIPGRTEWRDIDRQEISDYVDLQLRQFKF
jgi:hypothetical protein